MARWQIGEAPVGLELSESPMRRYHPCRATSEQMWAKLQWQSRLERAFRV